MSEDREPYAVWPNDDRMPLVEALAGLNAGILRKSDDFIRVALTAEQIDTLTYSEMTSHLGVPLTISDAELLNDIPALSFGDHPAGSSAMCVMEAVAFIAGEPWSDKPECVCPVISTLLRHWNDSLADNERDKLLRPLILRVVDSRGGKTLENYRATLAEDWLAREFFPVWLRLLGYDTQAAALERLSAFSGQKLGPEVFQAVNAAKLACYSSKYHFVDKISRASFRDAAGTAVWSTGVKAVEHAALYEPKVGFWENVASNNISGVVATLATSALLKGINIEPTRLTMQQSLLRLVDRMLAA